MSYVKKTLLPEEKINSVFFAMQLEPKKDGAVVSCIEKKTF